MALSNDIVLAGAPDTDDFGVSSGAVYSFDRRVLSFGDGCPDAGVTPALRVSGHPVAGGNLEVEISDGLANGVAILLVGPVAGATDVNGCSILVDLVQVTGFALVLDGSGSLTFPVLVPAGLSGLSMVGQVLIPQPAAPAGFSATNGFEVEFD